MESDQKEEDLPNSLNTSRDFVVSLFLDTVDYKMSRNVEKTKSFHYKSVKKHGNDQFL